MRRVMFWSGSIIGSCALAIGCSSSGAPRHASETPPTPEIPEARLEMGRAAYQTGMCFKCHGEDAMGTKRAPDLTDGHWDHCDGSVEGILGVLRRGVKKGEMIDPARPFAMNPATNLIKSEDELLALAQYVWSLSHH